jgi:2-polyprenyl-3-methyl-5-hydroxy-6-metoxy-1,4-benzoquinol methylase
LRVTEIKVAKSFSDVSIEKVKEYWNRRPCNLRHSPKAVGTREYFEEVEQRKYFVEPHIPIFTEFHKWAGKRVLEIGCGLGTDTINFARNGARVTAVDMSRESLSLAKRRAEIYGLQDRITFYEANAEELTTIVPVEAYDLIYSFGVIHHTPHPEKVIAQLTHYARPGTIVKVMMYHRRSWKVLAILFTVAKGRFWRLTEAIARQSEAQTGCPVTYTYTVPEIRRLLKPFETLDVHIDHIFPYRVGDYVQYRYVKEWYFSCLPRPLFRWLERHFGWHLCVTARA